MIRSPLATLEVKGVRINCVTGATQIVDCSFIVVQSDHQYRTSDYVLYVDNGAVTGYESFYLTSDAKRKLSDSGWCACAGTRGRWDELHFSPGTMTEAFKAFKQFVQEAK